MFNNYDANELQPGRVIGSFLQEKDTDFKNGVISLMEGFKASYSMDACDDFMKIAKNDVLNEQYKEALIGDILNESFEDPYLAMIPDKLEQLYENTRTNIIEESYGVSTMSPIVAYSLPILKKSFLQCNAKDIVMSEVASKPVIKIAFERKFLRDKKGAKYYIPEVFYNDEYKKVSQMSKGKPINGDWYTQPIQDLPLLNLSGGTIEARDEFALDIHICALKMEINGEEHIEEVDIKPDLGANNSFVFRVSVEKDGQKVEEIISGSVDFYHGTVSISSTGQAIKAVKFGGHLSNQNNIESLDLGRERETKHWHIGEGERLNSGFTIEKIKDMRAMLNIDVVPEIISDMSTVLTQFEDSSVLSFVKESLDRWKDKKQLPWGYTEGFVETAKFNCIPDHGMLTQSDWIEKELKFRIDRLIGKLKTKLKTQDIMFTLFAHPNNIELLSPSVNWVFDENTRVGGVQLDYRFGVMTTNRCRVHVVSSLKVDETEGLRIIAQPTTTEHITFKHYKYSLNIENNYRNSQTPLTPNIMATHRHRQIEVLPVQAQLLLEGVDFGIDARK
ncbi:hypothetical protein [Romboutsia ilealis]|uniref:hypothetical protein n=1 Tax=Romboutsia ilealis TaxID=1115758 RepID=UPI00272B9A13|nr:hypothetical protein [Romboutsia ilealis]